MNMFFFLSGGNGIIISDRGGWLAYFILGISTPKLTWICECGFRMGRHGGGGGAKPNAPALAMWNWCADVRILHQRFSSGCWRRKSRIRYYNLVIYLFIYGNKYSFGWALLLQNWKFSVDRIGELFISYGLFVTSKTQIENVHLFRSG